MSSILKALQKLERDREVRQAKPADIQRGILRQSTRRNTPTPWKIPATILVTALLAVLGTYLLMGGGNLTGNQVAVVSVPLPKVPAVTEREIVVLPPPTPRTLPQTSPKQQSISTDRPALTAPRRAPAAPSLNNDDEASRPAEAIKETAAPAPSPPPAPSATAPPRFSVAGIGWRDDPASRMAMINGSPVKVGSVIDGARVEEILPDRVRFSFQHRNFEVSVGGSASAPQ